MNENMNSEAKQIYEDMRYISESRSRADSQIDYLLIRLGHSNHLRIHGNPDDELNILSAEDEDRLLDRLSRFIALREIGKERNNYYAAKYRACSSGKSDWHIQIDKYDWEKTKVRARNRRKRIFDSIFYVAVVTAALTIVYKAWV